MTNRLKTLCAALWRERVVILQVLLMLFGEQMCLESEALSVLFEMTLDYLKQRDRG